MHRVKFTVTKVLTVATASVLLNGVAQGQTVSSTTYKLTDKAIVQSSKPSIVTATPNASTVVSSVPQVLASVQPESSMQISLGSYPVVGNMGGKGATLSTPTVNIEQILQDNARQRSSRVHARRSRHR